MKSNILLEPLIPQQGCRPGSTGKIGRDYRVSGRLFNHELIAGFFNTRRSTHDADPAPSPGKIIMTHRHAGDMAYNNLVTIKPYRIIRHEISRRKL